MKRMMLVMLCVLALLLAGCSQVNQTNSFVGFASPESLLTPVATIPLEATVAPQITAPPVVQLEVQPTPDMLDTGAPMHTDTPTSPVPTPPPEESPGDFGGFNG